MQPQVHHACFNGTVESVRGLMVGNAYQYKLPAKFNEFIMQELMVTLDQADDFIYEYRRFIILQALSGQRLYPSEAVDKVWKIHMGYGKNYVQFCMKVCNRVFHHPAFTGDSSGDADQS